MEQSAESNNRSFFQKYPFLTWLMVGIGGVTAVKSSFKFFKYLNSVNFFRKPSAEYLRARYGDSSWVVITGATDGIGKQFALTLASLGFNLMLIGRSQEKLNTITQELNEKAPNINCKTYLVNLSNISDVTILNDFSKHIEGLDISMLINSAGVSYTNWHEDLTHEQIIELINVNVIAPSLLTKIILPILKKREKKSAIINIGSFTGKHPFPFISAYSGSKAFVSAFSESLLVENQYKIDVLAINPHYVSTKMIRYQKISFETRSPEEVVNACFRDLGRRKSSFGHINHELLNAYYQILPQKYLDSKLREKMLNITNQIVAIQKAMARRNSKRSEIKKPNSEK